MWIRIRIRNRYGSRSTKIPNTDPIWSRIRFHNTSIGICYFRHHIKGLPYRGAARRRGRALRAIATRTTQRNVVPVLDPHHAGGRAGWQPLALHGKFSCFWLFSNGTYRYNKKNRIRTDPNSVYLDLQHCIKKGLVNCYGKIRFRMPIQAKFRLGQDAPPSNKNPAHVHEHIVRPWALSASVSP